MHILISKFKGIFLLKDIYLKIFAIITALTLCSSILHDHIGICRAVLETYDLNNGLESDCRKCENTDRCRKDRHPGEDRRIHT